MARDCFTLMFVLECPNEGHSFNFGIRHTAGYMGFFPPGGELDAYTPEGYANATIAVPVAEFHAMLELHVPGIPDRILSHGAGMRIGLEEQARLRAVLTEVMAGVRDPAAPLASPLARQQVERTLLEVFLAALRQGCGDCAPASTQRMAGRWRRLRQGRDFIAAHSREPVHLDDLCSAMDLSRRAVEMVFRETLGLSPLAFARHQRLHGARRALRDTRPAPGMVKKVALDWGFFHLGRFSRIYRQLFGEGPSETMMRHRGMG
jgi:AraC-like DNA-binding protein